MAVDHFFIVKAILFENISKLYTYEIHISNYQNRSESVQIKLEHRLL